MKNNDPSEGGVPATLLLLVRVPRSVLGGYNGGDPIRGLNMMMWVRIDPSRAKGVDRSMSGTTYFSRLRLLAVKGCIPFEMDSLSLPSASTCCQDKQLKNAPECYSQNLCASVIHCRFRGIDADTAMRKR